MATTTTAEIQRLFLSAGKYAVVGASKDQSKYGTKVRTQLINRGCLGDSCLRLDGTRETIIASSLLTAAHNRTPDSDSTSP